MTPYHTIHCTALAAALGTLGVPLDPTEPYERVIDTVTDRERLHFLFREASETDPSRKTLEIVEAWENRARFETADPDHPLVHMRAAHDARAELVRVIHGAFLPPVRNFTGERFTTGHLSEAAILKAHGFPLLLFTGKAFAFPATWKRAAARQIIDRSQRTHGASPAQWQARFLLNLSGFLSVAKGTPVLATREDNRTALFSADMSKKEQDRWLDLL